MKNYFDVTGKVALITGASSGLGAGFARLLSQQGAAIAIIARRKERLDALTEEITQQGGRCLPLQCDVTVEENVVEAIKTIRDHYGRIDILINNAGGVSAGKAEQQTKEQWDRVISTNLTGVYIVAREVGKVMIEQKYGKIINLGSLHSNIGINTRLHSISSYCASKGGVQMLTKALAAEWAQYNITVNAIGPAYFRSEMTQAAVDSQPFLQFVASRCPMGRIGNEGELDGAILYFASDASSYTTGQLLNVDGGWSTI